MPTDAVPFLQTGFPSMKSTTPLPQTLPALWLCAALALPASAGAQPTPPTLPAAAAAALPATPQIAPAQLVRHASQAMLLASAHAGSRLVAVGEHGVVLLSDDGGKTHRQARSVPVDITLTSVSFADDRQGWAVGHAGAILHTADGGETWTLQRKDLQNDRPLFAVHFFDPRHGVAVGLWSLVLTTEDGGATWQTVEMPVPEGARKADLNLMSLFADAKGRLFAAAEKGTVLRSDDQGRHWTYLHTGYQGSFWTGAALADGTLLAAGMRGALYRSTDDGQSWQRVDTHSQSSITALAASGRQVVGVGLDGLMLRSQDGGASFETENRPDRLGLTSVALGPQARAVVYSRQGPVAAGGAVSAQP